MAIETEVAQTHDGRRSALVAGQSRPRNDTAAGSTPTLNPSHRTFAPPTIDHPQRLWDRGARFAIRPSANFSKNRKAI
jgi:hypothetical protein